jgi:hypothetical protein
MTELGFWIVGASVKKTVECLHCQAFEEISLTNHLRNRRSGLGETVLSRKIGHLHNVRLQFDWPRIKLRHRQRFRDVDPLPKSLETKTSSAAAVSPYAR